NQTYATVTITAIDDMRVEGDETATFSVLANANYDLGTPNTATITIHDNDGAVLRDNADAYVRDGASANTNFGSATDIEVKKNMTGVNRQSYIKFDLTSVSAANIGSIQLRLYGSLNNANQQNVATGVFGSNNTTWSENAITWNNKPGTNTIALASATIINTTPQWYTWDITANAKSQLALGHKTITLVLQNSATSDPFATFASKESSSLGPQLVVAFA
ncbi:MAG TPA: DNRLRE domain-containing protein, partial [Tepidisphaeraceae bacterium]|nr:DNRLRE domain-containing protein [Tepidisphaeraceae bacterium]